MIKISFSKDEPIIKVHDDKRISTTVFGKVIFTTRNHNRFDDDNTVVRDVKGVSVCHPDDDYDELFGIKLAKSHLMQNAYKLVSKAYIKAGNETQRQYSQLCDEFTRARITLHKLENNEDCYVSFVKNKDKVLVIHPQDESTDMLKVIYEGKDWEVINSPYASKDYIKSRIDANDMVIMLGHGTPMGLLGCLSDYHSPYMVDGNVAAHLRGKETISIWCHSDMFFKPLDLEGLHTGMIISEVAEANMLGIRCTSKANELQINHFSKVAKDAIEMYMHEPERMKEYMLEHYKVDEIIESQDDYEYGLDEIVQFNRDNIITL